MSRWTPENPAKREWEAEGWLEYAYKTSQLYPSYGQDSAVCNVVVQDVVIYEYPKFGESIFMTARVENGGFYVESAFDGTLTFDYLIDMIPVVTEGAFEISELRFLTEGWEELMYMTPVISNATAGNVGVFADNVEVCQVSVVVLDVEEV